MGNRTLYISEIVVNAAISRVHSEILLVTGLAISYHVDPETMKPVLRGIFLTSEQAERTAIFYRTVTGLELEQIGNAGEYVYWKIDKDGVQLAIHDAEKFSDYSYPARLDSNVTHLYFKVENQQQFLEHLNHLKITPYAKDDVVVTVVDPDGRKVMFGTA